MKKVKLIIKTEQELLNAINIINDDNINLVLGENIIEIPIETYNLLLNNGFNQKGDIQEDMYDNSGGTSTSNSPTPERAVRGKANPISNHGEWETGIIRGPANPISEEEETNSWMRTRAGANGKIFEEISEINESIIKFYKMCRKPHSSL